MQNLVYFIIGLGGGFFGGVFGLGGGAIMVPALVFLFGLTQHQAQGTSLAIMLPPVGLLAVLRYYYSGNVKVNIAVMAAIGFLFGAFLGAHFIQEVPDVNVKRAFGICLVAIGLRMALIKG